MQEQRRQLGSASLGLTAIDVSGRLGWGMLLLGLRLKDYINQDKQIVLQRRALPESILHLLICYPFPNSLHVAPVNDSSDLTRKHSLLKHQ
jgi:hypothetical protein